MAHFADRLTDTVNFINQFVVYLCQPEDLVRELQDRLGVLKCL